MKKKKNDNKRVKKKKSSKSQDLSFDLEEYSLYQAHPVPGAIHAGIKGAILVFLSHKVTDSSFVIFFRFYSTLPSPVIG
jgi:hypothetical protein